MRKTPLKKRLESLHGMRIKRTAREDDGAGSIHDERRGTRFSPRLETPRPLTFEEDTASALPSTAEDEVLPALANEKHSKSRRIVWRPNHDERGHLRRCTARGDRLGHGLGRLELIRHFPRCFEVHGKGWLTRFLLRRPQGAFARPEDEQACFHVPDLRSPTPLGRAAFRNERRRERSFRLTALNARSR